MILSLDTDTAPRVRRTYAAHYSPRQPRSAPMITREQGCHITTFELRCQECVELSASPVCFACQGAQPTVDRSKRRSLWERQHPCRSLSSPRRRAVPLVARAAWCRLRTHSWAPTASPQALRCPGERASAPQRLHLAVPRRGLGALVPTTHVPLPGNGHHRHDTRSASPRPQSSDTGADGGPHPEPRRRCPQVRILARRMPQDRPVRDHN